ncbi:uncharacterized protein LOC123547547 [Mercenaria mercenaria]|uniref:uncharacterized protein LOC123547547 n=1 Tax=Mercenaria mercenaria TaxID=6596 RepID=UPI00234EBA17|nr:uncharacterized protein LOC123547547 [Mercenaria mercenaria]
MAEKRFYFILHFILLHMDAGQAANSIGDPDYESPWRPLRSQNPGKASAVFKHKLGEVPLLVDVQVKSIEDPNLGLSFPAIGGCPRDDDIEEQYGGVIYIYNDEEIIVSAPIMKNEYDGGMALYTANNDYFAGPNNQSSHDVHVKTRAWKAASLPAADFNKLGIFVQAGSTDANRVYIEETHGFGEYPGLVRVRTELLNKVGYFSDAVGANIVTVTLDPYSKPGYIVYGFNEQNVRVWVSSDPEGIIFQGNDGWDIPTQTTDGYLEIHAWKADTLPAVIEKHSQLGPNVVDENFEMPLTGTANDMFVQVWAESLNGSNAGYRFPGSGSLAYTETAQDATCTYGGLVYGYTLDMLRFWRPTDTINAGIICISNGFGQGNNSQREVDANVVVSVWTSGIRGTPEWEEIQYTCTHIVL